MATYVSLLNWTDQGIKSVRDTLDRSSQVEEFSRSLGVTFKEILWTIGQYDLVTTVDAPDDESATASLLAIGSQGNIRSTTLRAFTREEMGRIVEKLG